MSETQKRMAQRMIEILKEMGYLTVTIEPNGRVATASIVTRDADYSLQKARANAVIKLRQIFVEVIAMYEGEEIGKEMQKLKRKTNK